MAFDIVIEGGFFVVNDTSGFEHIRRPRADVRFTVNNSTYNFFNKIPTIDGTSNDGILGIDPNDFAFADLGTVTEDGVTIPIANEAALTTYLSGKISLDIPVDKETRGVYKMLAQIQPASPNTPELVFSPNANEEVHIHTAIVANFNNKDIDIRVYLDDDGTTYDDSTTIALVKLSKDSFINVVSAGNSIFMNNENGSVGFEADDVDITVTLWGVVYDLS